MLLDLWEPLELNMIFLSVNRISAAVVLIIGWKYADRKPLWFAIIRIEAINWNEIDQNEKKVSKNESRDERDRLTERYIISYS